MCVYLYIQNYKYTKYTHVYYVNKLLFWQIQLIALTTLKIQKLSIFFFHLAGIQKVLTSINALQITQLYDRKCK